MTNQEIIKAVTSNGMREWTESRVIQAMDEARQDEIRKAEKARYTIYDQFNAQSNDK